MRSARSSVSCASASRRAARCSRDRLPTTRIRCGRAPLRCRRLMPKAPQRTPRPDDRDRPAAPCMGDTFRHGLERSLTSHQSRPPDHRSRRGPGQCRRLRATPARHCSQRHDARPNSPRCWTSRSPQRRQRRALYESGSLPGGRTAMTPAHSRRSTSERMLPPCAGCSGSTVRPDRRRDRIPATLTRRNLGERGMDTRPEEAYTPAAPRSAKDPRASRPVRSLDQPERQARGSVCAADPGGRRACGCCHPPVPVGSGDPPGRLGATGSAPNL